ncbi:MAG TPA: BTAD domain-containing putative transcriptional regulator [Nocardioidaceae bacterium]|nr:BTAD domain-containing putative transcriptional regulator [Nocardioidaceae bacterium]
MTTPAAEPDLVLLDGVRWRGAEIAGVRPRALLAALVLQTGAVGGERLVDQVWAGEPPAHPTKALQVLVSRLRTLTTPDIVERTGGGYRLGLSPVAVDALALRSDAGAALAAWHGGDVLRAREIAARAATITVTPGSGDGPLAELLAAGRRDVSDAARVLGLAASACGDHSEALPLLEQALAARPDDETLLEALLRSQAATRGTASALDRYEIYRRDLRGRLGSDPGEPLRTLHAELLAQDSPVRAGVLFEHNTLVGRRADLATLAAMLRTSRVVSIVGAGGLGKTRLAHAVARRAEQPAVHFVELAGVTSPDGVAVEVATALGVRDSLSSLRSQTPAHRADLRARLIEALSGVPTLLILDNCEHVLDGAADLVAVLAGTTRRLTVLTTTRAPLGVAAERVYPLPELGEDDATELFCERATAARPSARLDEAAVRELVRRLDGLPLALELAAAKVRVMSVEDIARRLENRFELLRGGDRAAPERHQTLLAVIDWSWNLLDERGRRALRWLSVFRDGFSLDGASAVLGEGPAALDAVQDLVQQSLLTVHERDGRVRYRLLETVREFGRMQLVDAGEDAQADQALQRWAVAFALETCDRLFTPDQVRTMDRVREEEGNLADVLHRALDAHRPDVVVALMATLGGYWSIEGNHFRVLSLSPAVEEVVLDYQPPPELLDQTRAVLTALAANATVVSGDSDGPAVRKLRLVGTDAADPRIAATARLMLAMADAEGIEDLGALRDSDDPVLARLAGQWYSHALENGGDVEAGIVAARRSLELCDDRDGPWTRAAIHGILASLAMEVGDRVEARRHAGLALGPLQQLHATDDVRQLKAQLAVCDLADGDLDSAARWLAEVDREESRGSGWGGTLAGGTGRAELALARGDVASGLRLYREAAAALNDVPVPVVEEMRGLEPWVLYPDAAVLATHVVHGALAEVPDLPAGLATRIHTMLTGGSPFLDYPVAGAVLYALGLWQLSVAGVPDQVEAAVRLLAIAERFSYSRMLPALAWAHAAGAIESRDPAALERQRAAVAGVDRAELRDEAARLVSEPASR